MLPFFAWKIFSISFFIFLDFYLQVLFNIYISPVGEYMLYLLAGKGGSSSHEPRISSHSSGTNLSKPDAGKNVSSPI